MTTSNTASQSSNACKVDGCHATVFSTKLCTKHKKQQQRQRQAFIKTRREWREEFFVPDLKIKKGRNPRPSMIPLEVAAHLVDSDGERLPIKAKTKHLPKDDRDARVDTWGQAGKQANKTRRKNITQEFKAIHYAERDRAMFLGKTKLPRAAHVPTIPLTLNPSGWGKSASGNLAGAFTESTVVSTAMGPMEKVSGYRVAPTGVSKPCQCKACKTSRKQREI